MVQANSISHLVQDTFSIPSWITGGILTVLTAVVIIGGIKSIAKVCERLVPFMAIFYVLGCIILLVINYSTIPESIMLIIQSAFSGHAVVGGFIGAGAKEAIRFGIARGLFSNESGLGSAPIVAAAAQTKNPVRQALVSASGTFWDTVIVCAITGLVIVNSFEWTHGYNGAILTRQAFSDIPVAGPIILTIGLITFVFSTILGWSYYGEKAIEYLAGSKAVKPYRWLWVIAVFVGSVISLNIVWTFSDITNALMALPNLVALILLNKVIVKETNDYLWNGKIDE
jgi:AGCS family alanine or glycine:cation symporter